MRWSVPSLKLITDDDVGADLHSRFCKICSSINVRFGFPVYPIDWCVLVVMASRKRVLAFCAEDTPEASNACQWLIDQVYREGDVVHFV
jgi:hypothetical protein